MTKRKSGDVVCSHCGALLTGRHYNNRICCECKKEYFHKYALKNREHIRAYSKEYEASHLEQRAAYMRKHRKDSPKAKGYQAVYLKQFRTQVITGYGGKCQCCGESHYEFLAVDHVNGGGRKDRKTRSSWQIFKQIIKDNYPPTFRILCHNCNQSIGWYGYCPHTKGEVGVC